MTQAEKDALASVLSTMAIAISRLEVLTLSGRSLVDPDRQLREEARGAVENMFNSTTAAIKVLLGDKP